MYGEAGDGEIMDGEAKARKIEELTRFETFTKMV